MRIFDIALKDLSQIFRDKLSLVFLIGMPIAFTLFMGFAYKSGTEKSEADPRLALGWVNQDSDGPISQQLYETLSDSASLRLVELKMEDVDNAVSNGDVAAVLVVPADFSNLAWSNQAQLTLMADPASTNGQSVYQLLRSTVTRLMSSAEIGQLVLRWSVPTDAGETAGFTYRKPGLAGSQTWCGRWRSETLLVRRIRNQLPGIIVMFVIFGLTTSGQILVQERKTHTLQRMMTTSLHSWQIIAGHLLAMFSVVLVQELLLILFGQLALGVNYARQPLAVLLVSIALGLWIASMGLLIGVLVKDDSQVVVFSLMAMFIFSALGGVWFALEAASGGFAIVSRLTPSAWAMNGFQNLLIRGQGLGSVWKPVAILLAYALGFFLLAVWRFRKSEA
jgi:ABC-type transport system involved in multi-copper enzyme maturation permease subunit